VGPIPIDIPKALFHWEKKCREYEASKPMQQFQRAVTARTKRIETLEGKIIGMASLSSEILSCRPPSASYSMFLQERVLQRKFSLVMSDLVENTETVEGFMTTYTRSNDEDKNFLCELYLHGFCVNDITFILNYFVGEC